MRETAEQKPRILVTIYPDVFALLGDVLVEARTEDGKWLASHISSNESWARHDIGLTSDRKHDAYRACYPNGYDLVEVPLPVEGERDA